jgi:hypothetical protein
MFFRSVRARGLERRMPLPGDDLIPEHGSDPRIAIHGACDVWPCAQMGAGSGAGIADSPTMPAKSAEQCEWQRISIAPCFGTSGVPMASLWCGSSRNVFSSSAGPRSATFSTCAGTQGDAADHCD